MEIADASPAPALNSHGDTILRMLRRDRGASCGRRHPSVKCVPVVWRGRDLNSRRFFDGVATRRGGHCSQTATRQPRTSDGTRHCSSRLGNLWYGCLSMLLRPQSNAASAVAGVPPLLVMKAELYGLRSTIWRRPPADRTQRRGLCERPATPCSAFSR